MPEISQPTREPPATYAEQIALLWTAKGFLRLFGFLALLSLFIVLVLGLLVMAMFVPLSVAFLQLSFVFTPAYHLMGRIMGVTGLPQHLARPPMWLMLFYWALAIIYLGAVLFLLRAIFIAGFCNQNLICLLLRR